MLRLVTGNLDELFQLCTKNILELASLVELHPVLAVSVLVVLVLSPSIFWPNPRQSASTRTSESLQALLAVITPTRSLWPANYIQLAQRASTSRSKTIQLPLSDIYSDISTGRMEFRNPGNDLSDLFHEQVCVYGWLIQFHIGITFWVDVLRWIVISYLPSLKHVKLLKEAGSLAKDVSHSPCFNVTKIPGPPGEICDACSCPFTSPFICKVLPVLCLDFIPYAQLGPFIRALKGSWRDNSATIEFTTLGQSVSFLSTSFILCAVPFLPRKYSQPQQNQLDRTSNPLLISLHDVINLTMSSALTIKIVSNISEEYATKLNAAVQELETDRRVRDIFIDQWGVKGWREHRFLMAWEAALLKVGYLTRWTIVVE